MDFQYHRELAGGSTLSAFSFESAALADNPLGDPATRAHPVLIPSGEGEGLPLVCVLVGYTGFGHKVLNKSSLWQENLPERLARLMAEGEIPPAVFLWPSCETRLGGSQYLNSPGTGLYEDMLMDELIPAVEEKWACGGEGKRVVIGKSSGGYGALRLTMRRGGFFSAAGSHCGDMGFDVSHTRGFPDALACWQRFGGPQAFLEALPDLDEFGYAEHAGLEMIAMASCYSPDAGAPLGVQLPVDPETGEIRGDIFEKWLANDPLRMVEDPDHAESLRGLKALYLDAGEKDEFALQWGLRRMARRLEKLNIAHRVEYHEGGHFNTDGRYSASLPFLLGDL